MSEQRIPAGTYKGRAIRDSVQYGTTTNGYDQVVVDLVLSDIGETVSTFLVFSDKSAEYSIDRLRACGWQGDDLSNLDGIDANDVNVEVKYEPYQGEMKMRVQILTGGGRVILQNTMDEKAKRQFAARFKGLAAGSRGKAATPNGSTAPESFPFGDNQKPRAAGDVKL